MPPLDRIGGRQHVGRAGLLRPLARPAEACGRPYPLQANTGTQCSGFAFQTFSTSSPFLVPAP